MSDISRIFPEQFVGSRARSWPFCSNYGIRAASLSLAIIFKNDSGFLKVYTEGGDESVKVKPYPTKTMVRRMPPNVKLNVDMTPQEFEAEGLDLSKVSVDITALADEDYNKFVHMLRLFADSIGTPGVSHGRRASIMF